MTLDAVCPLCGQDRDLWSLVPIGHGEERRFVVLARCGCSPRSRVAEFADELEARAAIAELAPGNERDILAGHVGRWCDDLIADLDRWCRDCDAPLDLEQRERLAEFLTLDAGWRAPRRPRLRTAEVRP